MEVECCVVAIIHRDGGGGVKYLFASIEEVDEECCVVALEEAIAMVDRKR